MRYRANDGTGHTFRVAIKFFFIKSRIKNGETVRGPLYRTLNATFPVILSLLKYYLHEITMIFLLK